MSVCQKVNKKAILLFCFLILTSCYLFKYKNKNVNIIISPRRAFYGKDRAALVFFPASYPYLELSTECSMIFQKAFLKYKVFKIIEQVKIPKSNEEKLIDRAREMGFDILIKGELIDFFLGHDTESSRVVLSIKVYDTKTGATVWYMDCADEQRGKQGYDWIIYRSKSKQPPSPYAIIRQMAKETAKIMLMKK